MFQLVLSISLGLLLLFVLLLLVSELVTTYPVWKQFKDFHSTQSTVLARGNKKGIRRQLNALLLLSACAGIVCLLVYSFTQQETKGVKSSVVNTEGRTAGGSIKRFKAFSADSTVFFRLQTKWEAGKLYGNSTITFAAVAVKPLADCRYYFLDKDGFLIKAFSFSSDDFVLATGPDGKIQSLLHKFNTEVSLDDYLKTEKLQVVVDGKLPAEEPF